MMLHKAGMYCTTVLLLDERQPGQAVANGRLTAKQLHKNGTATYTWQIVNPINSYNIIQYIGKYVHWQKPYAGLKGKLDCDYWVLDYNLAKGKKQFLQADTMLHWFEYWMGPYPFYEDSYKLVEARHAGMEHQSAIAYGNGFANGFRGKDLVRPPNSLAPRCNGSAPLWQL
jgi:aminopeptidase N